MELERSTQVDVVLKVVGCMAVVGGLICAAAFWPQSGGNEYVGSLLKSTAITYAVSGIIAAVFIFGFAEIIRLLDEIRAQGNGTARSDFQSMKNGVADGACASSEHNGTEIAENADGTYSVSGRTYKSYETAQAFIDFMAARR